MSSTTSTTPPTSVVSQRNYIKKMLLSMPHNKAILPSTPDGQFLYQTLCTNARWGSDKAATVLAFRVCLPTPRRLNLTLFVRVPRCTRWCQVSWRACVRTKKGAPPAASHDSVYLAMRHAVRMQISRARRRWCLTPSPSCALCMNATGTHRMHVDHDSPTFAQLLCRFWLMPINKTVSRSHLASNVKFGARGSRCFDVNYLVVYRENPIIGN